MTGIPDRDRRRQTRDAVLCALEDAGQAMAPKAIAKATGLGLQALIMSAKNHPAYFVVQIDQDDGKLVASIDLHPDLRKRTA